MRLPLWLDHASVAVPDLGAAVEHLDRRLGLRVTVSPEAPERHARLYLDRGYLEVSAGPGADRWEATMLFLRFDDPVSLRAHLDAVGIAYRFGEYEGVDGVWDDVEIRLGATSLPTLIRRTAPAEVARDWPPPLVEPHRSGARSLAAVHVEAPSLDGAAEAFGRLVGAGRVSRPDPRRVRVALDAGELVLREGTSERIAGIVLGVGSLAETRAALGEALGREDDGVAWLDPGETAGLRLGFVEPGA